MTESLATSLESESLETDLPSTADSWHFRLDHLQNNERMGQHISKANVQQSILTARLTDRMRRTVLPRMQFLVLPQRYLGQILQCSRSVSNRWWTEAFGEDTIPHSTNPLCLLPLAMSREMNSSCPHRKEDADMPSARTHGLNEVGYRLA